MDSIVSWYALSILLFVYSFFLLDSLHFLYISVPKDTQDINELKKACFTEFLATLLLVFFGCGSAVASGEFLTQDGVANTNVVARLMPIAMTFGMVVAILVYASGKFSGGHLNPAVTFFLFLIKEISPFRSLLYVLSQLVGATCGSLVLWLATSNMVYNSAESGSPPFSLGANSLNPVINSGNGFVFEVMGTFILTMIISLTVVIGGGPSDGQPNLGPLLIGLAVFCAHIVLIPFTGCGINPARTFGPALVNSIAGKNVWNEWCWIYYIGPMCGALLSAGLFHYFKDDSKSSTVVRRVSKVPVPPSEEDGSIPAQVSSASMVELIDTSATPHKYHMPSEMLSTGFNAGVN